MTKLTIVEKNEKHARSLAKVYQSLSTSRVRKLHTRDLYEAHIYKKGANEATQYVDGRAFAQGDIVWMYGGMRVQIMKEKANPADVFSVTEKVRRSLQKSAHAQQKLEKTKVA